MADKINQPEKGEEVEKVNSAASEKQQACQVKPDLSKTLPPEVWCNIFQYLNRTDQLTILRRVSSHFTDVIDAHVPQELVIDEKFDPFGCLLPPPITTHITSIRLQNCHQPFLVQLPSIQQLAKVKTITISGPSHPDVVNEIIGKSPNLEALIIAGKAFSILLSGNPSETSYNIVKLVPYAKIKTIVIHKNTQTPLDIPKKIKKELFTCVRFIRVIKASICNSLVFLPQLCQLRLEYIDMPILSIHRLVHDTILPFVKRHSLTLKKFTLVFVPQLAYFCAEVYPAKDYYNMVTNSIVVHNNMSTLENLCLRLPQAVLNGVLLELFCGSFPGSDNFITPVQESIQVNQWNFNTRMMTHLVLEYDIPFQSEPEQQQQASIVIQQLIYQNQDTLSHIIVNKLDWTEFMFSNLVSFPLTVRGIFVNLCEATIGGLVLWNNINNQNHLMVQEQQLFFEKFSNYTFPQMRYLCIHNCQLNLSELSSMIQRCPLMKEIILQNNMYAQKVGVVFLSKLSKKTGLKKIVIGANDLVEPFGCVYWNIFKQNAAVFAMEFVSDQSLIIMP